MAEYIEREKAIDFIIQYTPNINGQTTISCVVRVLKEVPTEDGVKVVGCSKCKYQDDCARQIVHTTRDYVLEQNVSTYNKVDFCSCGELKDGEG